MYVFTFLADNVTEFTNPARGWYYHFGTSTSSYTLLEYDRILSLRENDQYSVIFRHFVLDSFRSQLIDNTTLQKISNDFSVARQAFFKLVIRFSYTTTLTNPRNDAPKLIILQHLTQLAPILNENSDVILAVQHGFIGTWGEGYYTDHFGDQGNISPQQQQDRQDIYNALLNSVPECVMVQVRTWTFKERLTGTSMPVSMSDAYRCGNDSVASNARTGLHDDCFLASENDFGTWTNPAVDRPRMNEQSEYSIFGGETCNPSSDRNACPIALDELAYFHFTYLNNLYHPDVLQQWRNESCYDTVTQKLGYRLVLVSSQFPDQVARGEEMNFQITLRNDGFAAPMNSALIQLVLQQGSSRNFLEITGTNTNPRFWLGNGTEHTVSGRVHTSSEMITNGTWNIFFRITDAAPSLRETHQYNILTVNQPQSAQQTGLNDLQRSVTITTTSTPTSTESGVENQLYCIQ